MRHVVCMGGGGFSMEPENDLLDDFVLSLVPHRRKPRVCFVPTASGDADSYCARFRDAFPETRAETSVLSLFKRDVVDIAQFLGSQVVVYVGGGNTANMLAIWRVHGLDAILREAYAAGTVLCGSSAGCLCWFECGITDSFGLGLAPLRDGLGLLAGSACPHYDSEQRRRPVYTAAVRNGFPAGIALDDAAAARYDDERLVEIVSASLGGRAFQVSGASEEPLEVRAL